ncbi:acetate--CoA ligase [Choiromyces venosus 120613-1]|uniref:acetate--CoA ligase n=1 Tax=Choiromyces venosus 120613-1 TaxID=1336337 RepID=A0A3N4K4T1_9PEZI|nr:acetate--CoA ligase [Choiromyces venosus 120613-1]
MSEVGVPPQPVVIEAHNVETYQVPSKYYEKHPAKPHLTLEEYKVQYRESIENPDKFWGERARELLHWDIPFQTVRNGSFEHGDISWFLEGRLNACYNCVDRHALKDPERPAIIYEADEPSEGRIITYGELLREVCKLAFVLKQMGVRKGDTVAIYMPMIPEALVAFLATVRIGAVHSVVFAGFSAESLRDRVLDARSKVVITTDEGKRGGKVIGTKRIVDDALKQCPEVKNVLVYRRTGSEVPWTQGRDYWWHEEVNKYPGYCAPTLMDSEDPLFLLYTSGSTGKPKVFEGTPAYPDFSRYWDIIEKHGITQFYVAPTALRLLKKAGDHHINKQMKTLRVLGSVGEPIAEDVWLWYHEKVGREECHVVDTYWQTETGSHVISPMAGVTPTKPGSATLPFFGIEPAIIDPVSGDELHGNDVEGVLAIKKPWPSMARTVWASHQRFMDTYLNVYKGYYFTGDGAGRDHEGYYWIRGRVDDVVNVSGHRLSTAEIEAALIHHEAVAEAAVVGIADELTGQTVNAFVSLKDSFENSSEMRKSLTLQVRKSIGPFAAPKAVYVVNDLPKTRSGKIMRRILRKTLSGEEDQLGDTSTLSDPSVVDAIIKTVHET